MFRFGLGLGFGLGLAFGLGLFLGRLGGFRASWAFLCLSLPLEAGAGVRTSERASRRRGSRSLIWGLISSRMACIAGVYGLATKSCAELVQQRAELDPRVFGDRSLQPGDRPRRRVLLADHLGQEEHAQRAGVDRDRVAAQGRLDDVGHGEAGRPLDLLQLLDGRAEVQFADASRSKE